MMNLLQLHLIWKSPLVKRWKDGDADDVDVHLYRSMIGSLMYLTASRLDIIYLKGQPTLGLWYSRDSPFELVAYTDSDYVGATQDRKSTTGGCQFLGNRLISWQCKNQTVVATSTTEDEYVAAASCYLLTKSFDAGRFQYLVLSMSKEAGTPDTQSSGPPEKVGEAVHKELGDRMERGIGSGSGPRCQDTILGDVDAQTRFEITSKQSNDPPLSRGYTLGSGEDSMELLELMKFCTQLSYKNRNSVLFLLLVYFNAAKLMLIPLGSVNAVRHMLMLPVQVPAAEGDFINTSIQEGTDCLPTATIFEELARMGYEKPSQKLTFYKAFFSPQWKYFIHTITQCLSAKSTAWNEFSSTMASLIICLATNQKFNPSKYIFDAMVKHLDGGVKFLLYPRFLQVFINQQLRDMSHHKKIFVNPFHTKKVFANIKRAGKDFSGRITPLFDTMMVQASEEVGEDSDHLTDTNQIPIIDQPSTSSQPKQKQKSKRIQRKEAEVPQDETEHGETQVLDLEKAKDAQAKKIDALKKRVQRLEMKNKSRTTGLKRLKKVDIVADVEKNEQSTKLDDSTAGEAVTTAGVEDSVAPTIPTTVEETLAQTLMEIKTAKLKAKGIVFHDQEEHVSVSKPTVSVTQPSVKDKGKEMFKLSLEAETIEEEKLARKQEEEANIALIESWDNTQAMMEADFELAQRLQTKEQGEITIEERSRLFVELMNKRKKHFAMLRAEEKKRKPPTKAQKRNQMSTYLKNMGGYKHNQLKSKSYEEIQKMFANEMRRVNTFIPMDSKLKKAEGSEEKTKGSRKKMLGRKRAGKEQQQESSKKQRLKEDKESDEVKKVEEDDEDALKKYLVIKKDDDIAIDVMLLATKLPVIVDYKLHKEGLMAHYELTRADGTSSRYTSMIRLLQGIDREDLQTLWKLVKIKHGDIRPEDEHERVLWGDLKVIAAGEKITTASRLSTVKRIKTD
ncbi:hypothetical protein Tco_0508081 [Tanacetum coccineum]